jgi:hypothetical protein
MRKTSMPASKSDKDKQVMDVAKPGKNAPDASAKPVIVGHGPMVRDPMVNADTDAEVEKPESEEQASVPAVSIGKKVIAPITQEEEPKEAESSDAAAPTSEPSPEEPKADETSEATDSADSAVVDAVIDQVGTKEPEGQSEEERKRQEELDKLVAEKKYFVPLGKAHRNSNRMLFIFTLFLLVVFLGLLLAIDAEIIAADITLPFDVL